MSTASSKIFRTLPGTECAGEAQMVILNAKAIWRDARTLEHAGSYGRAIALEVFALEELTKALVLLVDSHGFNLRYLRNLKVLDKDHQQRHVVIMIAAAFDVLGKEMQKGLKWAQSNEALIRDCVEDHEKIKAVVLPMFFNYYKEALGPTIIKLVEWASILGDTRTDGIYTEYRDGMHTPLRIGSDEYLAKSERIRSAYRALRTACVWLMRGGKYIDDALVHARDGLRTPTQYKLFDEMIGEYLRDRAVFSKLVGMVEGSLVDIPEVRTSES